MVASTQVPKSAMYEVDVENERGERNAQKQDNSSTESRSPHNIIEKTAKKSDSEVNAFASTSKGCISPRNRREERGSLMNMEESISSIRLCPSPPSHPPELSLLPPIPTHTPSRSPPQHQQLFGDPAVRMVL